MNLRLTLVVERFTNHRDVGTFTLKVPAAIVTITRPLGHELEDVPERENAICTVEFSHDFSPRAHTALENAAKSVETVGFEYFEVNPVQNELIQVQRRMADIAREVVDLIRWRVGALGTHNPLRFKGFQFLSSNQEWRTITQPMVQHWLFSSPFDLQPEFADEIQQLLNAGKLAPTAHSLIREARDLQYSDPRSALVLGVAALEVGTKNCIAELDPDRNKTMRGKERQDLERLLASNLSDALRKSRPDEFEQLRIYLPPKSLRARLSKARDQRNVLVHRFRQSDDQEYREALEQLAAPRMRDLLTSVQDLLWIFDYFNGNEWAVPRISWEMTEELKTARKVQTLPHLNGASNRIDIRVGSDLSRAEIKFIEDMSSGYTRYKERQVRENEAKKPTPNAEES